MIAVSLDGTNGLLRPRISLADSSVVNSIEDIWKEVSIIVSPASNIPSAKERTYEQLSTRFKQVMDNSVVR